MPKGMYKEGQLGMLGGTDSWGNVRAKGTGQQIREHLAMVGADFQMNIWREIKRQNEEAGYQSPSYLSFCNYFHRLKSLGLVEESDVPLAPSTATKDVPMKLYETKAYKLSGKVRPGVDVEAAWRNPQAECARVIWGR
jgi:hypothetical protein